MADDTTGCVPGHRLLGRARDVTGCAKITVLVNERPSRADERQGMGIDQIGDDRYIR